MGSRFEKNNCIFDSESDEESLYFSSDKSETDTSSISSMSSSLNNISSNESHSSNSNKNQDNKTTIQSEKENVFTYVNNSCNDSRNMSYINGSISDSLHRSKDNEVEEDHNANELSNKISKNLRQSIVEQSIDCEVNETLVLDSSVSIQSESIINNSCSEIFGASTKLPFKIQNIERHKVVEESSDSEASVESIHSFSTRNTIQPGKFSTSKDSKKEINTYSTEAIKKITSQKNDSDESVYEINDSLKNSSQTSSQRPSLSSLPEVSNEASTSVQSIDEYRNLEQQLADKRTAYQNILKAIKYCDPRKLKDGGKLLQEKLADCKEAINELKKKLENMTPRNLTEKRPLESNVLFSTSDQVTTNLGKKGLETHRVHEALTLDALVTLHNSFETCPPENVLEKDPNDLIVELMPHQKYALAWLLWREKQVPSGGILADDMGLGKTLTMIALVLRAQEYENERNADEENKPIVANKVKMYSGKTLVVCPSSVIGQWQGQIKQHCKPHALSSLIHHGKPRELQAKKLAAYDIVISSYGVIVEENKIIKGDKKGAIFRVKWNRIIIDEGHVIRNHKTKTAQALCELEAKHRWCLTGTPVQNKEMDMYSLLKFLHCSPFDNLTVWKRWVDNKSANGVKRLNTIVKSILLRRTKEELKTLGELNELPTKTFIPIYIKLDKEEQNVYHTVLHFSKSLLAEYILQEQNKVGYVSDEVRSQHHKLLNSANEIKTTEIFVLLLRLRQICCLPGLIHSMLEKESCAEDGLDIEDDPILQDLTSQMKRMSVVTNNVPVAEQEKRQKVLVKSNPVFQINRPSTKIQTVINIIKESIEANDKIIVVSQWSSLLQKLKAHITPIISGVVTLDGSVPVKFRPKIIDDFNNPKTEIKVLLLSLTAGGVGLNLIGGNRLIIFEPHWNPQLESQACDRIYRVGQKKLVFVYKIICKDTIEEKIELLQKKKLDVADSVLKGELKLNRHKITLADLKILFDIH